jgi:arabinogalactan endo-1,4-beta-galactosidase
MLLSFIWFSIVCATHAALISKGVDWSSLLIEEKAGRLYKTTSGQVLPLETLLKRSGVNTVRQRLWVNPAKGDYNITYNTRLARRARAAGLEVYLNMHYSDTWADPAHQAMPAAWRGLGTDALVKRVYDYTLTTMNAFQQSGIRLALVSIGNEITTGMLWPTGQLSKPDGYRNVAKMLHAASSAIRASSLSPKPKIMIHLDNGWNWQTQQSWYDKVLSSGGGLVAADYDIQAVSYYPFYNPAATLNSLGTSLNNMVRKYKKPVMVVETDWPTYCPNPKFAFPSDTKNIPLTPDGQSRWIKAIASLLSKVPGGLGQGLFYWEPAWIGNAALGSSCGWNLMVTDAGKDMGALGVFATI